MMLKPKDELAYLCDNDTLLKGLKIIKQNGYSAVPVISEDGTYVGTVSEGDFLWNILEQDFTEYDQVFISEILRDGFNPPVSIDADIHQLLLKMMDQNFVPVVDSRGCFVGIVTRKDVIAYFYKVTKKVVLN